MSSASSLQCQFPHCLLKLKRKSVAAISSKHLPQPKAASRPGAFNILHRPMKATGKITNQPTSTSVLQRYPTQVHNKCARASSDPEPISHKNATNSVIHDMLYYRFHAMSTCWYRLDLPDKYKHPACVTLCRLHCIHLNAATQAQMLQN